MRIALSVFFILSVLLTIESVAATSQKTQQLVDQYHSEKALWAVMLNAPRPRPLPDEPSQPAPPTKPNPPPNRPPNCPPPGGFPSDCIEAVCNQMSRFECDDRQDMLEVARACHNVNGDCIRTVCGKVSRFACDEKLELFEVTSMCRGLYDSSCIEYVCSRVSRFDCDELSEIREIAQQCR
ncbi:hypothetical protein ACLWBD_07020 [Bdellovibrio sp. HCB117]|uniref:hypothetical protein n=1 Tax=Bdellovibrio TaxID=958 RepID=UPI0009C13678|nr:hypothetical protein [Bdellovibrio bacteriovorus]